VEEVCSIRIQQTLSQLLSQFLSQLCPVPAKIDITIGRVKEYPPAPVAEHIGAGRGCLVPHVVAHDGKS
jgi:hypothetical protein